MRRSGTCRVSVYTNGRTPDRHIFELRHVCYIVGKVFSRRVQRRWNRGNRISGRGEKVELCGEWLEQGREQEGRVCVPGSTFRNPQGRRTSRLDGRKANRDGGNIYDPRNNPPIKQIAGS